MNPPIEIGGALIGEGDNVFFVAEAGINHNGSLSSAFAMVDAAAEAGADAIKFQTYRTDELVTASAPKAAYQGDAGGSQRDMLKASELSYAEFEKIAFHCTQRKILFLSTPFEQASADFLATLGVAAFKVPSGEITNFPLLRHIASKQRPMIVSTGMSDLAEVAAAVDVIEQAGNSNIVLLHCLSQYPADPREVNLRAMTTMRMAFGYPVGLSDHTVGTGVAVGAAALGAAVIEKHFTLDRNLPGPDHRASLEVPELKSLIYDIRLVTVALGDGRKRPRPSERDTANVARKSIVATTAIQAGDRIEAHQVAARRPGTGIPPAFLEQIIGRRAARALPAETLIQWSDLA